MIILTIGIQISKNNQKAVWYIHTYIMTNLTMEWLTPNFAHYEEVNFTSRYSALQICSNPGKMKAFCPTGDAALW